MSATCKTCSSWPADIPTSNQWVKPKGLTSNLKTAKKRPDWYSAAERRFTVQACSAVAANIMIKNGSNRSWRPDKIFASSTIIDKMRSVVLGREKNRIPDRNTSEASKQSTWQESQDFSTSTMPYRDKDTKSWRKLHGSLHIFVVSFVRFSSTYVLER